MDAVPKATAEELMAFLAIPANGFVERGTMAQAMREDPFLWREVSRILLARVDAKRPDAEKLGHAA